LFEFIQKNKRKPSNDSYPLLVKTKYLLNIISKFNIKKRGGRGRTGTIVSIIIGILFQLEGFHLI
jgi:hypothetical protein